MPHQIGLNAVGCKRFEKEKFIAQMKQAQEKGKDREREGRYSCLGIFNKKFASSLCEVIYFCKLSEWKSKDIH